MAGAPGRGRRLVAAVAGAVLAVTVAAGGSVPLAPAGATVGDPPEVVGLGADVVHAVVVHRATGRVFVARESSVQVFAADLTPLGTLAVGGSDLADAGGSVALLSPGTLSVSRIDPSSLAVTTWSLGARYRPSGLVAGEGRALVTAILPAGVGALGERALVEVDLATGATADLVTDMGTRPMLLTGVPWKTIAVEHVATTSGAPSTSRVWQITSPQPGAATVTRTGSIPLRAVRDIELSHDVIGLTVTSDSAPGEARAYALADLTPFPTIEVGEGRVALGAGYLLGVSTPGLGRIDVLDPFAVEDRLALDLDPATLPGAVQHLAFGPDDVRLYAVVGDGAGAGTERLAVHDLAPATDAVSPQVVDVDGGATVSVTGVGLAGARAHASGIPLTVAGSSDAALSLTTGPAWGGPAPVELEVTSRLHVQAPAGLRIRALQLGPYTDGHDLADGASRDFLGRGASPSERAAVDDALLADAEPGAAFAALSRDTTFRGPRPTLLRLYRATLGRAADHAGLEHWVGRLASGRSLAWVVRAFTASPEFRSRYGAPGDGAFVDLLYRNVLGRPADAAGRAHWLGELRRGVSRDRVVLLFTESREHRARTAAEVDVTLLVLGMLDRVPTAGEQASLVPAVAGGRSLANVATDLVRTPAYAAAHP